MAPEHLDQVVRQHRAAMGNSLWALLGERFLRRLYRALLDDPDFVGFVFVDRGSVRGFIAGTSHGPRMFARVLRQNGPQLALAAAGGLVRRPSVALTLAQTALYFRRSTTPALRGVTAESFFCSFEPDLRGKRISGLINKVLFDELFRRGHRYVRITTEQDNRGAVRQLASWGFERVGRFAFYGKAMVAWRLDLRASPRVDGSTAGKVR